jgi:hypothetical protein
MIAAGWSIALALSTMPIYWNNWSPNDKCEIEDVMAKDYFFFVLVPLFLLLWVAMFVIYWKIWREAIGQVHRLRKTNFLHGGGPSDWKSIQVSYRQTNRHQRNEKFSGSKQFADFYYYPALFVRCT